MSSDVDERALREIYLPAFQAAVEEAGPWTVMCSYNKIKGTWASENHYLLTEILKEEWGFQGFVVSDWGAVHNRIRSANAGLDLEMPGMGDLPQEILANAVRSGSVSEAVVDEMVRRILRVVFKARADGREPTFDPRATDTPAQRQLARRTAGEAVVLLKNESSVLPIREGQVRRLAVFGPNAAAARIQGGGSAHVNPYRTVSPLDAIRERAGSAIQVDYRLGCKNQITPPVLDGALVHVPGSPQERGFRVSYYDSADFAGEPFYSQVQNEARLLPRNLPEEYAKKGPMAVRWHGVLTAPESGDYIFSLTADGKCRLLVDGELVVDHWNVPDLEKFTSVWPFQAKYGTHSLQAGQPVDLVIEYSGRQRMWAGYELPLPADEDEQVAAIAAQADVALVFVGTTEEHETEGRDRDSWELPGEQADLIRRVAQANPRTVVVLHNGAPLAMADWAGSVAGILEGWFAGQETGYAVADVLFGDVNPSGKLPDTLPVRYAHNPSFLHYPGENGHLLYGESIFVGYRYYDAKAIKPLYPFGFGLSYTQFEFSNLRLSAAEIGLDDTLTVEVDVTNIGQRAGQEVAQLYVRDPQSRLVRPPKELKGFQKVALEPGETKTVTFTLTRKELSYYDPSQKGWVAEDGAFEVLVGNSSRDISLHAAFQLRVPQPPAPRLDRHARLEVILSDERGRAVLEKHMPELLRHPQLEHVLWGSLNWIAMMYMDILPEETVAAIDADLRAID